MYTASHKQRFNFIKVARTNTNHLQLLNKTVNTGLPYFEDPVQLVDFIFL